MELCDTMCRWMVVSIEDYFLAEQAAQENLTFHNLIEQLFFGTYGHILWDDFFEHVLVIIFVHSKGLLLFVTGFGSARKEKFRSKYNIRKHMELNIGSISFLFHLNMHNKLLQLNNTTY